QGVLNMNACIAYTEQENPYLTNGSVAFHKKMGFSLVGQFHQCGYKFRQWYDMVWMEKHIGKHLETPQAVRKVNEITDR
ncbi:MAG: GNAT family N-acetyltransferase, partial [Oscillospiraceae bacterium]|nr:GNAT family N-acetyltransferase [Oscillospiraceae bacterium]